MAKKNKKRAYIYKITNTTNNKSYIGVTNLKKPTSRWKKHILISRNKEEYLKNYSFMQLHQDMIDLGIASFTFEVIDECSEESGFRREKFWIKKHNTFGEFGYNKTAGGRGFNGRTHSEETLEKLSEMNKGKFVGDKNGFFGKHHSEETLLKISMANKLKKPRRNKGKNNPFFGHKHTEETIAIMKEKASEREYQKEWTLKRTKLSKEDVIEIKKQYQEGIKVTDLANKYEVSIPCIYKVLKKDRGIDQE